MRITSLLVFFILIFNIGALSKESFKDIDCFTLSPKTQVENVSLKLLLRLETLADLSADQIEGVIGELVQSFQKMGPSEMEKVENHLISIPVARVISNYGKSAGPQVSKESTKISLGKILKDSERNDKNYSLALQTLTSLGHLKVREGAFSSKSIQYDESMFFIQETQRLNPFLFNIASTIPSLHTYLSRMVLPKYIQASETQFETGLSLSQDLSLLFKKLRGFSRSSDESYEDLLGELAYVRNTDELRWVLFNGPVKVKNTYSYALDFLDKPNKSNRRQLISALQDLDPSELRQLSMISFSVPYGSYEGISIHLRHRDLSIKEIMGAGKTDFDDFIDAFDMLSGLYQMKIKDGVFKRGIFYSPSTFLVKESNLLNPQVFRLFNDSAFNPLQEQVLQFLMPKLLKHEGSKTGLGVSQGDGVTQLDLLSLMGRLRLMAQKGVMKQYRETIRLLRDMKSVNEVRAFLFPQSPLKDIYLSMNRCVREPSQKHFDGLKEGLKDLSFASLLDLAKTNFYYPRINGEAFSRSDVYIERLDKAHSMIQLGQIVGFDPVDVESLYQAIRIWVGLNRVQVRRGYFKKVAFNSSYFLDEGTGELSPWVFNLIDSKRPERERPLQGWVMTMVFPKIFKSKNFASLTKGIRGDIYWGAFNALKGLVQHDSKHSEYLLKRLREAENEDSIRTILIDVSEILSDPSIIKNAA